MSEPRLMPDLFAAALPCLKCRGATHHELGCQFYEPEDDTPMLGTIAVAALTLFVLLVPLIVTVLTGRLS